MLYNQRKYHSHLEDKINNWIFKTLLIKKEWTNPFFNM